MQEDDTVIPTFETSSRGGEKQKGEGSGVVADMPKLSVVIQHCTSRDCKPVLAPLAAQLEAALKDNIPGLEVKINDPVPGRRRCFEGWVVDGIKFISLKNLRKPFEELRSIHIEELVELVMSAQPDVARSPSYEATFDERMELLNSSFLTTEIRGIMNEPDIPRSFNWVECEKFGANSDKVLVPGCLDQRSEPFCLCYALKNLLQFQVNFLALKHRIKAPQLSLDYLVWVYETKIVHGDKQKSVTFQMLRWLQDEGVIDEKDYAADFPTRAVPQATRIRITWDLSFGQAATDQDFESLLKQSIFRFGGALGEIRPTKAYHSCFGEMVYEGPSGIEGDISNELHVENGTEITHSIFLLGWQLNDSEKRSEFLYQNSYGSNYGMSIAGKRGYGACTKNALHYVDVIQVTKWWD